MHNLGVDLAAIHSPTSSWSPHGSKHAATWSPCTGFTPTTPQAPTSPFVGAVWPSLNDQQKESTLFLGEHLVNASWILLRQRAICLFRARALRETEQTMKRNKLIADVVSRKEREIEEIMAHECHDDSEEQISPRRVQRAPPRRPPLTTRPTVQAVAQLFQRVRVRNNQYKRQCSITSVPSPIHGCTVYSGSLSPPPSPVQACA